MSQIPNTPPPARPTVLTIAGSDSGGGAGIQADLKTFAACGTHGVSAIAALTAQTTRGVTAIELPSLAFLGEQIRCLLEDFDVRAIKIGMLADADRIDCVADALAWHPGIPVVLDPVMVASSGARLLADQAIESLKTRLLPIATLITPNLAEAEVIVGRALNTPADLALAASEIRALGARWALMKGGHVHEGDEVCDRLYGPEGALQEWRQRRLPLEPHGTGCTLSSAAAAWIARGRSVEAACAAAIDFVHRGLQGAYKPGSGGLSVLDHYGAGTADG